MSNDAIVHVLGRLPMFQALPSEILGQLAALAVERSFDDGATVFREGDPGDAWYLVAEGSVRIVRQLDDGGTLVLTALGPGSSFGEMSVFDDRPRSAGAVADGATRLVAIGRDELRRLLGERPADLARLLVAIVANLSGSLRRATQNLVTVYETGKIAGTVRDPQVLAREVLTRLHSGLGATRSAIGLWNRFSESYEWLAVEGPAAERHEGIEPLAADDSRIAAAFESGEAVLTGHDDEHAANQPWSGRASIVVPLYQENEGLGVLVFATDRADSFGDDQQKLANATALQVSGALALARHEQDERDRERLERSRARLA
ncbi:MAG: cyclic nucleotide-binding domain-containing protein [bacterium]